MSENFNLPTTQTTKAKSAHAQKIKKRNVMTEFD